MEPSLDTALVWFRRDLRADDQAALYRALTRARAVFCAFVFDTDILDPLPRQDRRVAYILESLIELDQQLQTLGGAGVRLLVRHGRAADEIPQLARELGVQVVFANHDDDPYAVRRDLAVAQRLADTGIAFDTSKDHVVFERSEVLTQSGTPYTVYTPYKNAWLKRAADPSFLEAYPTERHAAALAPAPDAVGAAMPTLADIGFQATDLGALQVPTGHTGAQAALDAFAERRIDDYDEARNYPAEPGTSELSVHLRFGTISIRAAARAAMARMRRHPADAGAAVWLSELIWRDFYHQLLHHFPHVVGAAFKPAYDRIRFDEGPGADARYTAWCEGRTGYPMVDAAMVQLNTTGYMHNRMRMVTASFLIKDLGIHWRRGEAYFAEKLNDFDLASNNGGWQWASSSGCDAQPYFRIFNPVSQSRKFDAGGVYIRRWLPGLARLSDSDIHAPWEAPAALLTAAGVALGRDYPLPIVQHDEARAATLRRYAVVK